VLGILQDGSTKSSSKGKFGVMAVTVADGFLKILHVSQIRRLVVHDQEDGD
jgi:hypothetical protein